MGFLPLPVGGAGSLGAGAMGSTAAGVGQFGNAEMFTKMLPFLQGLGQGMGQSNSQQQPQAAPPPAVPRSFFSRPVRLPAPLPVRHPGIPL